MTSRVDSPKNSLEAKIAYNGAMHVPPAGALIVNEEVQTALKEIPQAAIRLAQATVQVADLGAHAP